MEFGSPEFGSLEFTGLEFGGLEFAGLEFGGPEFGTSEFRALDLRVWHFPSQSFTTWKSIKEMSTGKAQMRASSEIRSPELRSFGSPELGVFRISRLRVFQCGIWSSHRKRARESAK